MVEDERRERRISAKNFSFSRLLKPFLILFLTKAQTKETKILEKKYAFCKNSQLAFFNQKEFR